MSLSPGEKHRSLRRHVMCTRGLFFLCAAFAGHCGPVYECFVGIVPYRTNLSREHRKLSFIYPGRFFGAEFEINACTSRKCQGNVIAGRICRKLMFNMSTETLTAAVRADPVESCPWATILRLLPMPIPCEASDLTIHASCRFISIRGLLWKQHFASVLCCDGRCDGRRLEANTFPREVKTLAVTSSYSRNWRSGGAPAGAPAGPRAGAETLAYSIYRDFWRPGTLLILGSIRSVCFEVDHTSVGLKHFR